MLNRKHREALLMGLKGDDIYKHIYGVDTNDDYVKAYFSDTLNEVDVIKTTMEDDCCLHKKIDINLYGTNFTLNLLDLIRMIYCYFGYDSHTIKEFIEEEMIKIYGPGYDIKDILKKL
jgi:hypothetical protein